MNKKNIEYLKKSKVTLDEEVPEFIKKRLVGDPMDYHTISISIYYNLN
jgi:hypothetical protein